MKSLDISKMTADERAELKRQLENEEKQAKLERKENIKAYKELQNEYVTKNIEKLLQEQRILEILVKDIFEDYKSILNMKQLVYGDKVTKQDSHTATLPDGTASITIGYNVTIGFDGTESSGVEKIKDFINSLADDSEKVQKLSKMVNTFLKPNAKTGMLNPSKIIELSKLREEFNDQRFDEGLDIIFNAQFRRQNSMYVSGWKWIEIDGQPPKKVEFRFTI